MQQLSTKGLTISVRDNDATKMSGVNCEWCEEKFVSEVLRKYGVCVKLNYFLTLPHQGIIPQILKLKFTVHTSDPETET